MVYIILFFSAVFLTNAIPHFVKGIIGEKHRTPFAYPSTPPLNIVWASLNGILGYCLFNWALSMTFSRPLADIVFISSVVITALLLSMYFGSDPKARGKITK